MMHSLGLNDPAILLTTIAEQLGMSLVEWRATHSEPARRGNLLGFELELETAEGARQQHTIFVETEPDPEPREGVLRFEQPGKGDQIAVWVYPNDPSLPALAATVFNASASLLLGRLGVDMAEPQLSVLAYRPGKRAVIRVDGGSQRVYLKVVRPGKAAAIVERHTSFLNAGVTVPQVIGWSKVGLIALTELAGVEAQKIIRSLDERFLDRVAELVVRLSEVKSSAPARESLVDRLDWYRDRLESQFPDQKQRCRAVADDIRQLLAEGRTGEIALVNIHGDLHAGQIFVDTNPSATDQGVTISGLLDIDTAGMGDPADDAAAFYAHLLVLAHHFTGAQEIDTGAHVSSLAELWRARWGRDGDPGFSARARAISATHLLGHSLRQPTPSTAMEMISLAEKVLLGAI